MSLRIWLVCGFSTLKAKSLDRLFCHTRFFENKYSLSYHIYQCYPRPNSRWSVLVTANSKKRKGLPELVSQCCWARYCSEALPFSYLSCSWLVDQVNLFGKRLSVTAHVVHHYIFCYTHRRNSYPDFSNFCIVAHRTAFLDK